MAPEVRAQVCTAEDLIVYKLLSTRPRDYEDAVGIVARQRGRLDVEYVRSWLGQFEQALDDSELHSRALTRSELERAGVWTIC